MAQKVMLVEDDNNLREIYGARLLAEGYEIVAASDGEEALAMAVKEKPDLIISDVMMPKISGFDMLDILRSTPETKDARVIMMTALSQAEDKERADKLGADKYLVKSQVTLEDVARVVHELLDEGGGSAAPAVAAATTVAATTAAAAVAPEPVAAAPAPAPAATDSPAAPVATPTADPAAQAVSASDEKTEITEQIEEAITSADAAPPAPAEPITVAEPPSAPPVSEGVVIEPLAKPKTDINELAAKEAVAPAAPQPGDVAAPGRPATTPAPPTTTDTPVDPNSIAL